MKFKERIIKTSLGDLRISECRSTPADDKTIIYVIGDPTKPGLDPSRQLEVIRACAASELSAIDPDKCKYSLQHQGFLLSNHVGARIWIEHPRFAPRPSIAIRTRGAKAA